MTRLHAAAAVPVPAADPVPERYGYHAYGLDILSDLRVPEFAAARVARPDVTIARGPLAVPLPREWGARDIDVGVAARRFMLGGLAGYQVDGTDRITWQPDAEVDPALLSLPLVGPVIAMLLDLRGLLVLHGSAVAHQGRAALFLGDKGAGKSTTAAACVAAGMRLLTDDVLAVALDGAGAAVVPGFPQVKLSYAAADEIALGGVTTLPTPVENFGKHRLRLDAPFDPASAPACTVYLLERGTALAATPLAGVDALTAIMRFSYLPRFGESATRSSTLARHLRDCAALAGRVRVCRLEVPAALDRLAEVAALVARDLG